MTSLTRRLRLPVSGALLSTALVLGGCSAPWSDSPTDSFVSLVNDGDWAGAAGYTDDPDAAERYLTEMDGSIGETSAQLDVDDGSTTTTWTVPSGDEVTSEGSLSTADDDTVVWDPAIFASSLTPETAVSYSDDRTYGLPVLDARNDTQMSWTTVTVFTATPDDGTDPGQQASAIAEAVRPVIDDLDTDSVAAQIADAGEDGATLFALRPEDTATVAGALDSVAGVTSREEGRLLSPTGTASPVDGDLRAYWEKRLDDTAGWTLTTTGDDERGLEGEVLGQKQPAHSEPVRTTMDMGVQAAARRAVDAGSAGDRAASIVAINPSTGGLVASAQNAAADRQGTPAMTGQFPPGSTFKTVTTAAALSRGTVGPDDEVECPAQVEVDGRVIPNDDDFDLGTVPMHTAFAESCNTTQALISRGLEPSDMKDTAAQLGLGVDFGAPGMTSVTGSVPVTDPGAARVESAIGQGEVLASPFGLALMEASVAAGGRMVTPSVVQGEETTSDRPEGAPAPLDPAVVDALRAMMRETVTSGTASSLSDIDGLGGKTGTAEIGDGAAHGWFVGSVGDLAFCVFIEGADSSGPAVEMAGDFLRDGALDEVTG
ncbi:penicillin-binding transpeptidase domain-containing protein [Corynebacterium kalidii]|uniref:Penicillin-binding protein n=1 Tax=Corynebacterium kalidii TaxID=2931982 RepID=A0A9X1WIL5_9CORY|nr:penicillin-binding transpeptidase domain-containing protein [Corynebacterium kalidii]MCJ7859749.1 penicillin-binding protein [Corynebacterium kalidii]